MESKDSVPVGPSELTEDELRTIVRDCGEEWETIALNDPCASLAWANHLEAVTDRLTRLDLGRTASIKGGGLFLVGDHREAERCFFRAALLLEDHPADEADNMRRMAALRRAQKSLGEASRLIHHAVETSRRHGSREQIGKNLLELGNLHYDTHSYPEAADSYLESLEYLDLERTTYVVATHNLTCASLMARKSKETPKLANRVYQLRKTLRRSSIIQTRLLWLQLIVSIQMGACNHAIRKIPAVISRLRKERAPTDDIATAYLDLAQALWSAGEREKACSALEEARDSFSSIYGISPAVIEEISTAIDTLRSTARSTVEPWDIRRRIVTTASESRWRVPRSAGED